MSSKNIVNKDHYDIAGRDKLDERDLRHLEKQEYTQSRAAASGQSGQNFIPGAAPVGEANPHANSKTDAETEADAGEGEGIEQADEAGRSSSID